MSRAPVLVALSLAAIAGLAAAFGPLRLAGGGEAAARIPYPSQAIVVVVPAPRGGGTDVFARELARLVETDLGQRVIVDNRPRDGGLAGIGETVRARPDGYTVAFVWNSPLTVAPLFETAPFARDDYRAVMSIGFSSYVLCARPDFPADDAAGLLARLAERPGAYSYGNDGAGGMMRLAAERIFREVGAEVRGVAFAGATETARNFLAGTVDLYGGSLAAILPYVRSGEAKCLLLTSADDNPALPQASGLGALGLGAVETVLWWGLIAPASMPDAAAARLEDAFLAAARSAAFSEAMAARGATARPRGADATAAMIDAEIAGFAALVETQ